MIPVSNGWMAVQTQTLQPETFVEITYIVTEPGLQADAVSLGSDEMYFSETASIVKSTDVKSETYATLEHGIWGLDGSRSYFNGSPKNPGYVSNVLSGEDCTFETYPTITIDFSERHIDLIPGITITWSDSYNEWATDYRIKAYRSGAVVAQTTVIGNTNPTSAVFLDLEDYTKITIEILRWSLPYHRARCNYVCLGISRVYTKSDLLGFEHSQSVDLLSAELPQSSVTFRLRNDTNVWNPDTPSGFEKYLIEQQQVDVRYGMEINGAVEWIKAGTFWLSEWETPSNGMEAVFTARDAVEFMVDVYTGPRSGTLYDIAEAALIQANLPTTDSGDVRYTLDPTLQLTDVDFSAESNKYTIAEILQMVAHAGCCVFYQDRWGIIHIEKRSQVYSNYMIEPSISYTHPEYTIGKPLKAVSVEYGKDLTAVIDVAVRGETQTIKNPLVTTEELAISVGETAKEVLTNRKVIKGEYRSDMRLDVLDNIIVVSKYAANVIGVTEVTYSTTGGTIKGTYTGRVVSINLTPDKRYSGEYYVGEL